MKLLLLSLFISNLYASPFDDFREGYRYMEEKLSQSQFSDDQFRAPVDIFKYNPKLKDCHPYLIQTARAMWDYFDFIVFTCKRTQKEQDELVKKGYSKTRNSYHLTKNCFDITISCAVDIVVVDEKRKPLWNDNRSNAFFSGAFTATYYKLKDEFFWDKELRAGINFRMDCKTHKPGFLDIFHYELRPEEDKWNCDRFVTL